MDSGDATQAHHAVRKRTHAPIVPAMHAINATGSYFLRLKFAHETFILRRKSKRVLRNYSVHGLLSFCSRNG